MEHEYTKDFINLIKIFKFFCLMITFHRWWKGLGLLKTLLGYNCCLHEGSFSPWCASVLCINLPLQGDEPFPLSGSKGRWYGNLCPCHRHPCPVHVWASLVAPVRIYHCTDLKLRTGVIYLTKVFSTTISKRSDIHLSPSKSKMKVYGWAPK